MVLKTMERSKKNLEKFFEFCNDRLLEREGLTKKVYFKILKLIVYYFQDYPYEYWNNSKREALDYHGIKFINTWLEMMDYLMNECMKFGFEKYEYSQLAKLDVHDAIKYWKDMAENDYSRLLTNLVVAKEHVVFWTNNQSAG